MFEILKDFLSLSNISTLPDNLSDKIALFNCSFSNLNIPEGVTELKIKDSKIEHLVLPDSLTSIKAKDNHIHTVSLSPNLENLEIQSSHLHNLIYPTDGFNKLKYVNLSQNELLSFDITCSTLLSVNISYNKISDISVKLPYLQNFNIIGNDGIKIKYLDFIFNDEMYATGDYLNVLTKGAYTDLGNWNEDAYYVLSDKVQGGGKDAEYIDMMEFYDKYMDENVNCIYKRTYVKDP